MNWKALALKRGAALARIIRYTRNQAQDHKGEWRATFADAHSALDYIAQDAKRALGRKK